ncbi:MAG: hypothetical protein KGS72_17215 [Cyanobacteria bacterium REEB67]|nr:hypothetical protein [Cyanobacteria bacterium REEB67]
MENDQIRTPEELAMVGELSAELYCDCCFEMGQRFQKFGRKFKAQGQLALAEKMEAEAVVQLDAWRKAKASMKVA